MKVLKSLHALGAAFALVVVAVSLAGVVALGGGCGPKGQGAGSDTTKAAGGASNVKVGLVFDVGGRGDKSFNDSAYAGLERAMKELGIPQESWRLLKQTIQTSASGPQVSLDVLTTNQETVEDERGGAPDEEIQRADLLRRLRDLLDSIDEREATVLRLRYGLNDEGSEPMTLKEIGKVVGLTRERVRQIEREALIKLYRYMGEE